MEVPFVHKLSFVFGEVWYLKRALRCTVYTAVPPKKLNFQAEITDKKSGKEESSTEKLNFPRE